MLLAYTDHPWDLLCVYILYYLNLIVGGHQGCMLMHREMGKGALLSSFTGSQCVLRRGDGAEVVAGVPPYPLVLHRLLANHQWDKAAKLCHAVKVCMLHAHCKFGKLRNVHAHCRI